jgi:Transposase and inactivated derivatives
MEMLGVQYPYVLLDEWMVMLTICMELSPLLMKPAVVGATSNRKPLGRLIGAFKTVSSRHINEFRGNPGAPVWQRNYYEHVIRNEESLNEIRQYIAGNPMRWAEDEENPENIGTKR